MSKRVTPEEFIDLLSLKEIKVETEIGKAVTKFCMNVSNTAKKGITETNVDNSKTNGNHHPSLPGNYPASDTGKLRQSISFDVKEERNKVVGRVGSSVVYSKFLEFGTSRMSPRKWLKPSLEKNEEQLKQDLKGAVAK